LTATGLEAALADVAWDVFGDVLEDVFGDDFGMAEI
jgi:hypothetical protein